MRRPAIIALSFVLPCIAIAQAQSPDQALSDFRAQILKNQFMLRGYSDDPITKCQWNDTKLLCDEPKVHALGMIKPDSVELRGNKLKISGKRQLFVRDKTGTPTLTGGARAVITVDLKGADASQIIPALKSELFFPTPQDAFAALPTEVASIFSGPHSPSPTKMKDCRIEGQKSQHPTVTSQPEAEFSEEARRAGFSGTVEFALTIGEDGTPGNIWLVRPAGMGLDENAADAVVRYRFHPATCDGKPVKTTLFIDIGFAM